MWKVLQGNYGITIYMIIQLYNCCCFVLYFWADLTIVMCFISSQHVHVFCCLSSGVVCFAGHMGTLGAYRPLVGHNGFHR